MYRKQQQYWNELASVIYQFTDVYDLITQNVSKFDRFNRTNGEYLSSNLTHMSLRLHI